ncbi:MAG: hypothetical protein R2788_06325 [Saprospiraceae bacterium]
MFFSHCKETTATRERPYAHYRPWPPQGINATFSIDSMNGDITHNGVLPMGTNVTSLVADFQFSRGAQVYVNNVEQVSGVTPNNFSNKVLIMCFLAIKVQPGNTMFTSLWKVGGLRQCHDHILFCIHRSG